MCEKRTVGHALSEPGPTARLPFGLLSACTPHGIKTVLWVTTSLNVLDEVKGTMPYRHGPKSFPAVLGG